MKTKLLAILLIAVSFFFNGCDEDSLAEAVIGSNSITLSGDINKSFDTDCIAGMIYEDSTSGFVAMMQPKNSDPNSFIDQLVLMKESDALPAIGKYNIGFDEESIEDFFGFYSANDTTFYTMYSGSVEITESNSSKIAGTFDLNGYYGFILPDSTRELNITGKFSSIPINLNY